MINLNKDFQVYVGGNKEKILECVELFRKIGRTAWDESYVADWVNTGCAKYLLTSYADKSKIEWNCLVSDTPMPEYTLDEFREAVNMKFNTTEQCITCEKVIMYRSEDGTLFDTEEACVKYQYKYKLINILEDNVYALRHEDGEEVLDVMKEHKELFLSYSNNC